MMTDKNKKEKIMKKRRAADMQTCYLSDGHAGGDLLTKHNNS